MQAAVGVFLRDRDHETQVRLDHLFLGLTGFFFALLDLLDDAAEFGNVDADILSDLSHLTAQLFDLVGGALEQGLPSAARLRLHPLGPAGVQFVAAILFDELTTVDARLIGELHHAAVDRHDLAVDAVELVDQRFDPVVVQVKRVHQLDDLGTQFLIGGFLGDREGAILVQRRRHPQVLHFGKLSIVARDQFERLENTRLQRGFHRGERKVRAFVLVVIVGLDRVAVRVELGLRIAAILGLLAALGRRLGSDGGRCDLFFFAFDPFERVAEGGLEIDHVAQKNFFVEKFVAPDRDGLEGQRALAEARDHRVAASLDALGDRDFALARQQLDRTHLAQIHPHRVIGTIERFRAGGRDRDFARTRSRRRDFAALAAAFFLIGLFGFDDVDAHFGEHRHDIFDLVPGDLILRHHLVELVIGDEPAFLRLGDHPLHGGLTHIEGRRVVARSVGFIVVDVFGGHVGSSVRAWLGSSYDESESYLVCVSNRGGESQGREGCGQKVDSECVRNNSLFRNPLARSHPAQCFLRQISPSIMA